MEGGNVSTNRRVGGEESSGGNQSEREEDMEREDASSREGRLRLELAETNRQLQQAKKAQINATKVMGKSTEERLNEISNYKLYRNSNVNVRLLELQLSRKLEQSFTLDRRRVPDLLGGILGLNRSKAYTHQ